MGVANEIIEDTKSLMNSDLANDAGNIAGMMGFGDELKSLKNTAEQSMSQLENGLK